MLWINRAGKQQATTHSKCFLNAKEREKGEGDVYKIYLNK